MYVGGAIHSALQNSDLVLNLVDFLSNRAGLYGGSIYLGEDHSLVHITDVSVRNSFANSGGGLYLSQFSRDILIALCNIVQNSANTGGGLMSFVDGLSVRSSIVESNVAASSYGGVFIEGASDFAKTSFIGNVAGSSSGGLQVSGNVDVTIDSCDFVMNRASAGSGGALSLSKTEAVLVRNSSFLQNSASVVGGAAFVGAVNGQMSFLDTRWEENVADESGGALYVTGSTHMEVNGSTFSRNIVQAGSGSAIGVHASHLSVYWNVFSGNEALRGGGTVFWDDASGMDEPLGLQAGGNVFDESNTAGYGPRWATEAHHLRLLGDQEVYTVIDYKTYAPLVGVTLEDVYGQAVVTDSTTTATMYVPSSESASCNEEPGFLSGSTTVSFVNGTANFTLLEPLCAPNHSLVLAVTSSLVTVAVDAEFEFDFRACSRGEYYGERICNPCENGSYSFTDAGDFSLTEITRSLVCQPCPPEASYCHKDTMVLRQGYWRSDEDSTNIVECPWDVESCLGGESNGDASCGSGYRGPLCAICEDEHHFVSSSRMCEQCDDTSSFVDPLTVTLIALACICVIMALYSVKNIVQKEAVDSVDALIALVLLRLHIYHEDTYAAEKDRMFLHTHVIRIRAYKSCIVYFTFYQIVSTLPFILADIDFPDVYDRLMSAVSVVNLAINQEAIVSCSSSAQYDYVTKLVVATTYPIGIVLILGLCSYIHMRYIHGDDSGSASSEQLMEKRSILLRYKEAVLVLSFLILPSGS
jgi:hypothetical protein